eukprot:7845192-Pyramimonas_sp.AAC.1
MKRQLFISSQGARKRNTNVSEAPDIPLQACRGALPHRNNNLGRYPTLLSMWRVYIGPLNTKAIIE